MTGGTDAKRACDMLFGHWEARRRLPALPDDLRPRTRGEGYAIQAWLEGRSAAPLFGWKIAATSAAGQRHINVDGPLAGRLLAERVLPDGAEIALSGNLMRVAEVEFAFRFARDVQPRAAAYGVDEVLAAVGSLHPAIEIPDSRYEDFCAVGAPQLIADNACAHLFILGPASTADWRGEDLSRAPVSAVCPDGEVRRGSGANVLGDPRIALTWLVNELSGLGIPLRAGQVVTTGTCVVPVEVSPGDTVRAEYGAHGSLSVRFA